MAYIGDTSHVQPDEGFDVIPAGEYPLVVEDSIEEESKTGKRMIKFTFEVIGPNFTGRKVFERFVMENDVAMKRLKALMVACGRDNAQDTSELHGAQFLAKLKVEKGKEGYEDQNRVTVFKPLQAGQQQAPPMPQGGYQQQVPPPPPQYQPPAQPPQAQSSYQQQGGYPQAGQVPVQGQGWPQPGYQQPPYQQTMPPQPQGPNAYQPQQPAPPAQQQPAQGQAGHEAQPAQRPPAQHAGPQGPPPWTQQQQGQA